MYLILWPVNEGKCPVGCIIGDKEEEAIGLSLRKRGWL